MLRRVVLAVFALLVAAPTAQAASTCAAANYAVAPLQSNVFYIDTATSYLGSYVGYKVTNSTGASKSTLWLRFESFAGGQVRPATGAATTGAVPLAALAQGASTSSYAYLKAAAATASATTYDAVLYTGRPGSGGTEVCRETQTVTSVQDVIKAAANKVLSATGPSAATLGGTFTLSVNGSTGTIGAGIASDPGVVRFSPAVAASWPSDAFRLVGVTHQLPLGALPSPDVLSRSNLSGADRDYTVTYTFRVVGPTSSPTPIVPVQNIASGTQVKHTDPGSFSSLAPIPVVTSDATLSVAGGAGAPYTPGASVPLSVTVTNAGSGAMTLDEIRAAVPSGWTVVPGSWKRGGVSIPDAYDAGGGVFRATGPFDVAGHSSLTLTFDATAGAAGTSGAFTAVGELAGGQIDGTTDPSDDKPATTTLTVLGAPAAHADSASVASGVARDLDVVANDDTTGATPTLTILTPPTNGTATVVAGKVRYQSTGGFTGTDSFVYEIATAGGTSSATATVSVAAPPAAPSPGAETSSGTGTAQQSVTLTIPSGGSVTLLDGGAPATTVTITGQGTYTLDPATGVLTFAPVLGFHGAATPVGFRVTDGFGQDGTATYTATVNAPAPPAPTNRTSTDVAPAAQSLTLAVPAHTTVALVGGNVITTVGEGQYVLDPSSGGLTFTPEPAFHGTAAGVSYRLTDAYGQSATATYRPTVTLPAPPAPANLTSTGVGTATHTVTATIPAGGAVTLVGTPGAEGTYALDPQTGTITFAPQLGFSGTGTGVSYRVTDIYGQPATATYRPTVTPPAAPTATDRTSTGVGTAVQRAAVTAPAGGSVTLLDGAVAGQGAYAFDAATGTLSFTPVAGFKGVATPARFRVTDAYGQSAQAVYRPTVTPPPAPPAEPLTSSGVAGAKHTKLVVIPEGGSLHLLDAAGRPTDVVAVSGEGIYRASALGFISFEPEPRFAGLAIGVRYVVADAYGQRTEAAYAPSVTPTADAPAPVAPAATCASRRQVTLHWLVDGAKLRRLTVSVNGRERALAPTTRSTEVDMRGLPASIVQVTVRGVTTQGIKLETTRRYRTCTTRRAAPPLPTLRLR